MDHALQTPVRKALIRLGHKRQISSEQTITFLTASDIFLLMSLNVGFN